MFAARDDADLWTCNVDNTSDWRTTTLRLADTFVDGVRSAADRPEWAETAPTSLTWERPVAYPLATFAVATRNYCKTSTPAVRE